MTPACLTETTTRASPPPAPTAVLRSCSDDDDDVKNSDGHAGPLGASRADDEPQNARAASRGHHLRGVESTLRCESLGLSLGCCVALDHLVRVPSGGLVQVGLAAAVSQVPDRVAVPVTVGWCVDALRPSSDARTSDRCRSRSCSPSRPIQTRSLG